MKNYNGINQTKLKGFELLDLPNGWEVAKFENLVLDKISGEWGTENKESPEATGCYVLRGTDFSKVAVGKFDNVPFRYIKNKICEKKKLEEGEILIELSGGSKDQPTGRIFLVTYNLIKNASKTILFSNFVKRLKLKETVVSPEYFYRYWQFLYNQGKTSVYEKRTTGIRNFKYRDFLENEFIPLPPLPEQKKIVAVLSAVQEAKEKTEEVIRAAKELKKSLLEYLFTYGPVSPEQAGNVTLKETEIGMIPEDWEVVKLKELHLDVSDGNYGEKYPRQSEFIDSGIPFIRANNIRDLKITWKDMRYISEEKHEFLQKGHLKFNDILITTRGEIGQVAFVDEEFVDCNINAQIVRINTKDKIISKFFLYCLACEKSQAQFYELKTGSTLQQLPVGRLLGLKVPLPPFDEQQKIAEILSAIDKKIEAEENKKKSLEELFKTLLNNLMTGIIRVNNLEV